MVMLHALSYDTFQLYHVTFDDSNDHQHGVKRDSHDEYHGAWKVASNHGVVLRSNLQSTQASSRNVPCKALIALPHNHMI